VALMSRCFVLRRVSLPLCRECCWTTPSQEWIDERKMVTGEPARGNKKPNARRKESQDSRKERESCKWRPEGTTQEDLPFILPELLAATRPIHVESPCHMLCSFCMRANHSSGFSTQPYSGVASMIGAYSFVDSLDAVDGLQTDYEHAGQAVIETSLSYMIGRTCIACRPQP